MVNVAEMMEFVIRTVEKIVGKAENGSIFSYLKSIDLTSLPYDPDF